MEIIAKLFLILLNSESLITRNYIYGMKHSIRVLTPSWGEVNISSRSDTTVLELFWLGKSVLSANQCKAALSWLVAEG
jgi:hypothetical protein